MFSTFAAGLFLVATGAIGWDVSYLRGFFQGGRWAAGPIWWQIALGLVLLRLGLHLLRRLEPELGRARQVRTIKHVGHGTTTRAKATESHERLPGREPKT
jgi:hypothetical protein